MNVSSEWSTLGDYSAKREYEFDRRCDTALPSERIFCYVQVVER